MAAESRESTGVANSASGLSGFFEATYRRAYSLAFRITGEATAAEAATESAYRRLLPPFTEEQLFDLVRQDSLGVIRSRPGQVHSPTGTASTARSVFESLGQLERTALELAYSGGMSAAEIAALLDMDETAIRNALRAGLMRLGKISAEEGPAP